MGKYISENDVTQRLLNKVKFTDDTNDGNAFQRTLLREYIDQSEAGVEYDLSPRYANPFQTTDGKPFNLFLSLRGSDGKPTMMLAYSIIRNLCQLQAVIRILENDFGRGTVANADKYIEKLEDRYKSIVEDKLLAKKKMVDGSESQQWQFPPIANLALNYHNTEADDGYMGQILSTTQTQPQFPQFQINDPSENFWNGVFDDPGRSPGNMGSNGQGPFSGSGDNQ